MISCGLTRKIYQLRYNILKMELKNFSVFMWFYFCGILLVCYGLQVHKIIPLSPDYTMSSLSDVHTHIYTRMHTVCTANVGILWRFVRSYLEWQTWMVTFGHRFRIGEEKMLSKFRKLPGHHWQVVIVSVSTLDPTSQGWQRRYVVVSTKGSKIK